jgi:hypothetical protein
LLPALASAHMTGEIHCLTMDLQLRCAYILASCCLMRPSHHESNTLPSLITMASVHTPGDSQRSARDLRFGHACNLLEQMPVAMRQTPNLLGGFEAVQGV